MASAQNVEIGEFADEDDDELFEDAEDTVRVNMDSLLFGDHCVSDIEEAPRTGIPRDHKEIDDMDLAVSLRDARTALDLFMNNRFEEAIKRMEPWADSSMYHSLALTTLQFMQAMLSFEQPDIEAAIASTKKSINIAHSHRKKHSVIQTIKQMTQKIDYSTYTDVEVHAELVFAESLLLRALLSFVQDENLISFLKGALKIKTCYQSYKECRKIAESRDKSSMSDYEHFNSGVNMGIGAFNLLISQLPARILRLLEFVGFSGNRSLGLSELRVGADKTQSLRGPLCSLVLLAYNTLITYILGTGEGDIEVSEAVLKPCLKDFPKSALFLFFHGRIEQIKGNIDDGIKLLSESIECQSEWKQFHHICYWELMWCYAYKCDWLFAMKYAEKLANENKWSKATYIYLKGSFLALCDQSENTKKLVHDLYNEVPNLTQRIAGKSIPIEKFALKKVKLYKAQNNQLNLAALEMIYVWNGFSIIGKNMVLLDAMSQVVEDAINLLLSQKNSLKFYYDNYSLALLLKGVILAVRGQHFQADMCYQEIIAHYKDLKYDTYLAPWAAVEQGLLRIQMGEYAEAEGLLEAAKNNYKGYALESRLHFKIHAAHTTISRMRGKKSATEIPTL